MMIRESRHRATDSQRRALPPSIVARKSSGPECSETNILRQRLGNQGVQRLMSEIISHSKGSAQTRSPAIQAKFTVSQSADAHEQEADRVANAVMRMPAADVQEIPVVSSTMSTSKVQRLCSNCEEEIGRGPATQVQRRVHAAGAPLVEPSTAANIQALRGSGQALPEATRAFFEPRFGADFSQVRVHTDARAADTARAINAKAFTVGRDIAFGAGQYAPESPEGRRLLAHELAHVVQQGSIGSSIERQQAPADFIGPSVKGIEGVVSNTWSAALREAPTRTSKVLADLPRGHKVVVKGNTGWLRVQTFIGGRTLEGYVSHELIKRTPQGSGPTVKDVLRLDQTLPIKGLATDQPNYVDYAIVSAPLGPDFILIPRTDATGQNGISIRKGDFHIDKDSLSGFVIGQNQVYRSRSVAEAVLADLDKLAPGMPRYAYYLSDGIIFPTTLSDTTLPNLMPNVRLKREQDIQDLKATSELGEALLWWYIGARFPIKVKGGTGAATGKEALKEAAKGGTAAEAAFRAAKVADDLVAATKSLSNAGQKMLGAARQLSAMANLTAAQKVQVMLEFFKRIGFAISKAGVVDDGARFVMKSEDSKYAFAFVKDTGEILYGKFNMQTLEYVWQVLK